MKKSLLVLTICSTLVLTACGGGGESSELSSTSSASSQDSILSQASRNSISGRIPSSAQSSRAARDTAYKSNEVIVVEAHGDNGSYYRTETYLSGDGENHIFSLELVPNIGYRIIMIVNEGTADEIITPLSFYADNTLSDTHTRFKFEEGNKVYLGDIDTDKIIDSNNDGIADTFILNNEFNPLKQTDVDKDGKNDFDDDDHGNYHYKSKQQDSLDPDGDGIINVYDKDDDNDGINDEDDDDDDNDGEKDLDEEDTDGDGVPNVVDINSDNNADRENKYLPSEDKDLDGLHDLVDEDDDNDGELDIHEDDDDDGIPNSADLDDDNDGTLDIDEDDDADGVRNGDDNDSDGDGLADRFEDDDNDGEPNANDTDDDGDGTRDLDEDDDNDGLRNHEDHDDDGDGVADLEEDDDNDGERDIDEDTDGDGVRDGDDLDDDNDGVKDEDEDDDNDGTKNSEDEDDDNDGTPDIDENDTDDTDDEVSTNDPTEPAYRLLAVNDLGMHCADIDYQVFSILPPFNVVHAQVIEQGLKPKILNNEEIKVTYQATSNENDPILALDEGNNLLSINTGNGSFKTNFWANSQQLVAEGFAAAGAQATIGTAAYQGLYPGVQHSQPLGGADLSSLCDDPDNTAGCPSLLMAFEPSLEDTGLPVPELHKLYPDNGESPILQTVTQKMPGDSNQPQTFESFVTDQVFFENFGFGTRLKERNWFAAEGIPILPVDDSGRTNPYPLMKISAVHKSSNDILAELDVVLPVASEADCQNCHVEPIDCADTGLPFSKQSSSCNGSAVTTTPFTVMTLDDNPPGLNRLEQLLNTAKINILRLHDVKHGAKYQQWDATKSIVDSVCDLNSDPSDTNCLVNQTPIQCSQCHYSPALDLAQAGPVDEPEQGINGRQQTRHASMSNVMHSFHGALTTAVDGVETPLFPPLASAGSIERTGLPAINPDERTVLENTCYQCHPGNDTQCLRGAMATGGVICQDCHGDMEQVGNDFSLKVNKDNPGDFVLDGSLRIPWASEPGCQSCHTGDALTPNHPENGIIADDGIRLLQAFEDKVLNVDGIPHAIKTARQFRAKESRFAENTALNKQGEEVSVLYRLSKDEHGGVMCEGCHNSTHAIWPNPLVAANDNIASIQLQGHTGTLSECTACHGDNDLGNTLAGPHGMHPVGAGEFTDGGHEDLFKSNKADCQSCHGVNGEGTVLSRSFTDRSFTIEECEKGSLCPGAESTNFEVNLSKGEAVSCGLCHENVLAVDFIEDEGN